MHFEHISYRYNIFLKIKYHWCGGGYATNEKSELNSSRRIQKLDNKAYFSTSNKHLGIDMYGITTLYIYLGRVVVCTCIKEYLSI